MIHIILSHRVRNMKWWWSWCTSRRIPKEFFRQSCCEVARQLWTGFIHIYWWARFHINNLFLNIGSKHRDTLQAVLFEKETGLTKSSRRDKDYRRRYSVGHYLDQPECVPDSRLVIMISDSIYYEEFESTYLSHLFQ